MTKVEGIQSRNTFSKAYSSVAKGVERVSVSNGKTAPYISEGWRVIKQGKTKTLLERHFSEHKAFELLVWRMVYLLGFDEISGFSGATITRQHGSTNQLDVVATSSDLSIVFECKCSTSANPRAFDANVDSPKLTDNVNELRKFYKSDGRNALKTKGVFCLSGIRPTKADQKRAQDSGQKIIDESTVRYYIELAERIGAAAYYQFLAEIIGGEEMPSMKDIRIPCVKTRIGSTVAYQLALTPEMLLKLAYVAHRSASALDGYQRMVTKSRINSMRQFIDEDGFFPTNIVINFRTEGARPIFEPAPSEFSTGDARLGMLRLPATYGCAWVIDGQHRILSYAGHKWASTSTLPVTAFEGLDRSKEAALFEEINSKQKRVSAALLAELFSSLHINNPNARYQVKAMASATVDRLKNRKGGPLFGKIVGADERATDIRCITVKSFMDALDKVGFFFWKLNGSKLQQGGPFWMGDPYESVHRAEEILACWFDAVQQGAPEEWKQGERGVVATNRGVAACLRVLQNVFQRLRKESVDFDTLSEKEICDAISPFGLICGSAFRDLRTTEFEAARTTYGSSAVPHYHYTIVRYIRKEGWSDFESEGYDQWLKDKESVNHQEAMLMVTEMEKAIQTTVRGVLDQVFGEDGWRQVPEDIRSSAAALREKKNGTLELWNYLNLIDYRPIVTKHWKLFESKFGWEQGKDKGTQWMVDLNNIRSDAFHAAGNRVNHTQVEALRAIRATMVERELLS